MWKLLILLSIFILIKSQEAQNATKKPEDEVKTEVGGNKYEREPPIRGPSPSDFSVTLEDMDKLLACSYILSVNIEENRNMINQTAIRLNKTFEEVSSKVSYSRLHKCAGLIKKEEASLLFKDLDFKGNLKDAKRLVNLTSVDYAAFNENSTFSLTNDETFTAFKYEKARAKFEENRTDKYKKSKDKIWFLEYFENYPLFKSVFFLIVIFIFTFGMIYLLNKVTKKPKAKKNKKKNN